MEELSVDDRLSLRGELRAIRLSIDEVKAQTERSFEEGMIRMSEANLTNVADRVAATLANNPETLARISATSADPQPRRHRLEEIEVFSRYTA